MSIVIVFPMGHAVAVIPYELWPVLLTVAVCKWREHRRKLPKPGGAASGRQVLPTRQK